MNSELRSAESLPGSGRSPPLTRIPIDWRLPSAYPSAGFRFSEFAWVCLRRSPAFRSAWAARRWSEAERFGVERLCDPEQERVPRFLRTYGRAVAFAMPGDTVAPGNDALVVTIDPTLPAKGLLEVLNKRLPGLIAQWRRAHPERSASASRRRLPNVHEAVLAIRVYDGKAAGASSLDIGLALFANSRESKAGASALPATRRKALQKQAIRAFARALWMIDEGYLQFAARDTDDVRGEDEIAECA